MPIAVGSLPYCHYLLLSKENGAELDKLVGLSLFLFGDSRSSFVRKPMSFWEQCTG